MDRLHTELDFRLQHRHGDGSWGTFEPEPHSPSEVDPERAWSKGGRIYACTTCEEKVVVAPVEQEPPVD